MQRVRVREETPTSGSQTITNNVQRQQEEEPVILHLQAVSNPDERRVTWDEEVIDNENMGKKSSKICCIYHKPRQFGESSDEDSSSSSSSSDESDSDDDVRPRRLQHNHGEELPNGGEPCERHAKSKRAQKRNRKPSPNAYERQPRQQGGKKKEPAKKTEDAKA